MQTNYTDMQDPSSAGASKAISIERLGPKQWKIEGFDPASGSLDSTGVDIAKSLSEAFAGCVIVGVEAHVPRGSPYYHLNYGTRSRSEWLSALSSAMQVMDLHVDATVHHAIELMQHHADVVFMGDTISIMQAVTIAEPISLEDWRKKVRRLKATTKQLAVRTNRFPRRVLPEWLEAFTRSEAEPTTRSLASLIAQIEDALGRGAGNALDDAMAILEPSILHPTVSLALLRVTFPLRRSLPNWAPFLRRVESDLRRRGMEVDRILRGLK